MIEKLEDRMPQKLMSILAICILTFLIWLLGWFFNHYLPLPGVIRNFAVGFGIIATVGYIWTVIKELGD